MRAKRIITILAIMAHRIREHRVTNRIREQRIKRGMSQSELAKVIGCSTQTVSKMETGVQTINDRWLASIAAALGVPQAALLNDSPIRAVPSDGDIVKTDLERLVLRFFRNLPPQGQDDIVKRMTVWSASRISRMAQSV